MTWASDPVWWPFFFILIAGALPTMIWRWLAVAFAADIDEESEVLVFVRCVSTALVAAVVAQFIFLPNGALAEASLILRGSAAAFGFCAFFFSRSLIGGIIAGEAVLIAGMILGY